MGPNVNLIRTEGYRFIVNRVPREVRKELNAAVKVGELGHIKADGLLTEMYFHPDKKDVAMAAREERVMRSISIMAKVCI